MQRDEVGQQPPLVDLFADLQAKGHGRVGLDRADTVDATDGGNDDHVIPLQQRARRRMPHPVDLLVDGRFLLDVGVGASDVGLGLVVVVVGNEVFDRVVRKEALEFAVELGGERLIGSEHKRRALGRLDHLCDRKRLAGAGDAEEDLIVLRLAYARDQPGDCRWLVPLRLVFRHDLKPDAAFRFLRTEWPVRGEKLRALDPAGHHRKPDRMGVEHRLRWPRPRDEGLENRRRGGQRIIDRRLRLVRKAWAKTGRAGSRLHRRRRWCHGFRLRNTG